MNLVVAHYHLRPGGVRRVIELALPFLAAALPLRRITFAVGEDDPSWIANLRALLPALKIEVRAHPAFGYSSEQSNPAPADALDQAATTALAKADALWFHNPGLARNLPFVAALHATAAAQNVPTIFHHHDFWFENRWARAAEFRPLGYRSLDAVARVLFPPGVAAVAINRHDQALLGPRALWLPNLAPRQRPPAREKIRAARRWLRDELGDAAPTWIVPTRFLRRKNLAEAALLTRWLRPEAWLITTAGVTSAGERAHAERLTAAARAGDWRVRFSIRAGRRTGVPDVRDLVAASEAMLLPSTQEGFGLPYLEAAEAGKPLIARALPNVLPDLRRLGIHLPQIYDEVWIDPSLIDLPAERKRQTATWQKWRAALPASVRALAKSPPLPPGPLAFSRLTLTAQLEVLAHPPTDSWEACVPLNSALETCRDPKNLRPAEISKTAEQKIGGPAYARRFIEALEEARQAQKTTPLSRLRGNPAAIQKAFIEQRLQPTYLFPMLMTE